MVENLAAQSPELLITMIPPNPPTLVFMQSKAASAASSGDFPERKSRMYEKFLKVNEGYLVKK